ncbi:MAG: MazG nucleotide pyrophosphohydrolase domain-containing protein [Acidimicrobiales bacterium]
MPMMDAANEHEAEIERGSILQETEDTGLTSHVEDTDTAFTRLKELVATLRHNCPWDMVQTHMSLGRHLIEEAYETLEALEELSRNEPDPPVEVVEHLKEELGDLMFQVFFHAMLEEEIGRFTIRDVVVRLCDKLVARHPHVFGDVTADSPEAVATRWEKIKTNEEGRSMFSGIPKDLPALSLVAKLQRKADSVGVETADPQALLYELEHILQALKDRVDSVGQHGSHATTQAGEALQQPGDIPGRATIEPHVSVETYVKGPVGKSSDSKELQNTATSAELIGSMLLGLARLADSLKVDAEGTLRQSAFGFREKFRKEIG